MQPTEHRRCDDLARSLDLPRLQGVARGRLVWPHLVVLRDVLRQDASQ